jgi:hypothetical protein
MTARPFEIKGAHKRRVLVAAETLRMADLAVEEAEKAQARARAEADAAGRRMREAQESVNEARGLASSAAQDLYIEVTRR